MSESVKEQIVRAIGAQIATISWVKNVQRMVQGAVQFRDAPFVTLAQADDLLDPVQTRPYTTRRLELVASVVIRQTNPADLRSSDEILNGYGADVEAVVMANPTVNGLAVEVKPPEWLETEIESKVPHIGVAMRFSIVYRHLRHNPYLQE